MVYELGFNGIRNGATFYLDSTTKTAIKSNTKDIIGKVVTLVDNATVGYGEAGDRPLGFVESIEEDKSGSETWVVSVLFNQSQEGINCAGTEIAGEYLACDGTGGLAKSTTATNAVAYSVDSTNKVCTVYISG